jgi:hypothetical protein
MIRQAERNILVGQHFENPGDVPARIAEFKTVPALVRQHLEKFAEPISVRLEVRRELKKDGTDLAS